MSKATSEYRVGAGWARDRREVIVTMHDHFSHSHGKHHEPHSHAAIEWRVIFSGKGSRVARVALLGLGANIVLCLMKAVAGIALNSAVLLADAIHAISDTFGDIITLFCLYKAQKKPTRKYPFGYGKLETIGSVGISAILFFSSLGIIVHAATQLARYAPSWMTAQAPPSSTMLLAPLLDLFREDHGHGHGHAHGSVEPSALIFAAIGIFAKEALYHYTLRKAQATRSSVLEASAYHHRIEVLGSLGSFFAIAGSWLGFPVLDPLGGLCLALVYGRQAWTLLFSALQQLCDRSVPEETYAAIARALDSAVADVQAAQRLDCAWTGLAAVSSGPFVVAHATLHFSPHVRLAEAHAAEQAVDTHVRTACPAVRTSADADYVATDEDEHRRCRVVSRFSSTWEHRSGSPSSARACSATQRPTRRGASRPPARAAGRCGRACSIAGRQTPPCRRRSRSTRSAPMRPFRACGPAQEAGLVRRPTFSPKRYPALVSSRTRRLVVARRTTRVAALHRTRTERGRALRERAHRRNRIHAPKHDKETPRSRPDERASLHVTFTNTAAAGGAATQVPTFVPGTPHAHSNTE